jgi:hypothetical protein
MINNINWNNIRPIHNSLNDGFEELVCQLAKKESIKGKFFRIGKPDSGRECYWELDSGDLYMWQAKYFTASLTPGQWSQIKKSVITAIDNHPKLSKYYICLPLDLPDGKVKGRTSLMDKWKAKVTEWKSYAISKGISLEFEYWGSSELISKLSKEENKELINIHFYTHRFSNIKEKLPSPTLNFKGTSEQLQFYSNIQKQINVQYLKNFVHFNCTQNNNKTSTERLSNLFLNNSGGIIVGKSGCGKSILARWLSYNFNGCILFLEAKYYETNINEFIDKEVKNSRFDSGLEFFKACQESKKELLIIIDGLNECSIQERTSLTLEMNELINQYNIKFLITTQLFDEILNNLIGVVITVDLPEIEVKKAIAEQYCGSAIKLQTLLSVAKTSIEAKLIGEIGIFSIEKISLFDLFETFVRKKLDKEQTDGIPFLSSIANILSTNLSFSLSLQKIECIIKEQNISPKTLHNCINSGILIQNLNKISFTHEMFFHFFIANNISKGLNDGGLIINALNAPKNDGSKIFIIGAIEDTIVLEEVLNSISDDKLLFSLLLGEGGEYSKIWANNTLSQVVNKIEQEVKSIAFEIVDDEYRPIQVKSDSIINWTNQEWTFISIIPGLLYKRVYLKELFDIVGHMDACCNNAFQVLFEKTKEEKLNLRSGIFTAIYANIGTRNTRPALSIVFSSLISGWASFNNNNEITSLDINELLKDKKLSNGQFYMLLHLCKYEEKAQLLYPFILDALKNKWKYIPHILKNEILERVGHCYATEEQRIILVDVLNAIHSRTQDPFLSTNIFEALSSLNALDEDAIAYESTVENQIKDLLLNSDEEHSWNEAATLYNYQFDHPYSSAFYNAINKLNPTESKLFYEMALKATYGSSLFTSSLILMAVSTLGNNVSPHLLKFIETPISDETMPQNSLEVFIIAHIILGQYSYTIRSRYENEENELSKTLFAFAEIYYWLNRSDMDLNHIKEKCKSPSAVLFNPHSNYTIESIWQSQFIFTNFIYNRFPQSSIIRPDQIFSDEIAQSCRFAIINPHHQKSIYGFSREEEIIQHAIELLKQHGNISDLKIFRELSNHPVFGKSAIEAIKYIEGQ